MRKDLAFFIPLLLLLAVISSCPINAVGSIALILPSSVREPVENDDFLQGNSDSQIYIFEVPTYCSNYISDDREVMTRIIPLQDLPLGTIISIDQLKLVKNS